MASSSATSHALDLPPAMLSVPTPVTEWVIVMPVLLGLCGAALLLILGKWRSVQSILAGLFILAILACDAELLYRAMAYGPQSMTMGNWLPPFGISFTVDVMGAGFALAAAFVSLIVVIYAQAEVQQREIRHGYYSMTLLLLAGVSGAFLTGDLFNLYVWFEVLLIASFGLLVIGGRKIELDAAVKYGFLNFLATTFFLIALGFLYGTLGTLNMADIIRVAPQAPTVLMTAIAALLLLAFSMKAAAFPLNAWLPASYHAPDPGTSALFAGLLTKVGTYALLRSLAALLPASRDILEPVIMLIAVLTLVISPLGAIAQTNLRRAIGFIVMGGVGSIIAGLAIYSERGLAGGIIYAFNSMLAMSALYLVAGLVERMTGATDSKHMGGVYTASSPLSILFIVLVFAAAGLPPFLGFWPKILLIEGSLNTGAFVLTAAILLNSILTTIAGSRLWAHIFWRAGHEGPQSEVPNEKLRALTSRERGWALVPTAVLVAGITLLGLWPNLVIDAGRQAAVGILDTSRYVDAVGLEVGE